MARKFKGPKKDKWDKLPSGFKEAVMGMSTAEIHKRIGDVAILESKDKQAFKQDPEVAQARERLKHLSQPFKENLASYKLQIEFCRRTLDDKDGGATTARAEENAKPKAEDSDNPLAAAANPGSAPN